MDQHNPRHIKEIRAREVLDSRARPTVEVEVVCMQNHIGSAIVPSGASTGSAEALELRDGDARRYGGLGVQAAVANVREVIAPALRGRSVLDQHRIDQTLCQLDGTDNKSRLGANALLGVSLAVAHAAAAVEGVPLYAHLHRLLAQASERGDSPTAGIDVPRLPLPQTNMISGGLHAGGNLDFQDVLIAPRGAPRYAVGLEWIVRVYRHLGRLLSDAGYEGRLVGDEGGYGPRLASNEEAIEFVLRAIEAAGLQPGAEVTIELDVAATHFFDGEAYHLSATGGQRLSRSEMIDQLERLVEAYPITSLEDPLAEDDWEGWQELTARLGTRVMLVGDDLFATNPARLRRGIEQRVANAALIKLNQIGTLSETLDALVLARAHDYARIVSARSGETEDWTIADLAVASAAERIKIGSIVRSERLAKYNRLLRIAEWLEQSATASD